MPDQLLSIEDSSLTTIANAIRTKGGTNASLEFPSDFVSALQAIETEATVTPKITPQQTVLTPSSTSFAIASGFHDGTGTVSIQTEAGSANPTASQQTYYPSTGKFFSSFYVGGLGAGYRVVTGTVYVEPSRYMTISGLPFTSSIAGAMWVLQTPHSDTSTNKDFLGSGIWWPGQVASDYGYTLIYKRISSKGLETTTDSRTYMKWDTRSSSEPCFRGTYRYIIWGT